jgi:hypothetical protein
MSWKAWIDRLPIFFVVWVISFSAGAQQSESEDAASDSDVSKFYEERLRTAPPEIKRLITQLTSRRTGGGATFRIGYTTALDRSLSELTEPSQGYRPRS